MSKPKKELSPSEKAYAEKIITSNKFRFSGFFGKSTIVSFAEAAKELKNDIILGAIKHRRGFGPKKILALERYFGLKESFKEIILCQHCGRVKYYHD